MHLKLLRPTTRRHVIRGETTLRRCLVLAALMTAVSMLFGAGPAAANHGAPGDDKAYGQGSFFQGQATDFVFDVSSGPLGESPTGTASVTLHNTLGTFVFAGPVGCMKVSGNRAIMVFDNPTGSDFTLYVQDNPAGSDRISLMFSGSNPNVCTLPPASSPPGFVVTSGDLTVTETPPPCRMSGLGNFLNQDNTAEKGRVDNSVNSDISKAQKLELQFAPASVNNFFTGASQTDRFKLTSITSAECADYPAFDPGQGQTADTIKVLGTGTYQARNSALVLPGYKVEITIQDGGESGVQPGADRDYVDAKVLSPANAVVNTARGLLKHGNEDARDGTGP